VEHENDVLRIWTALEMKEIMDPKISFPKSHEIVPWFEFVRVGPDSKNAEYHKGFTRSMPVFYEKGELSPQK
jgi:hypothetical protein